MSTSGPSNALAIEVAGADTGGYIAYVERLAGWRITAEGQFCVPLPNHIGTSGVS